MKIYDNHYYKKYPISDDVWLHGDGIHTYVIIHLHHDVKNKALKSVQTSSPKEAYDALINYFGDKYDPNTIKYRVAKHMTDDDINAIELERKKQRALVQKMRKDVLNGLYTEPQVYRGIPLKLIRRSDYHRYKAFRYTINDTNQNVWIPKKHCDEHGRIKSGENIDYVFRSRVSQLEHAGITQAIPGIKRKNTLNLPAGC